MERETLPLSTVECLHLQGEELRAAAREVRGRCHGNRITFSPKVFIPLTKLCRDHCGYCTFAQPPARLGSPYLKPEQVLEIARAGAAVGCHEALFTLGESPESQYPVAASWLARHGFNSTIEYLAEMAELVLEETGLLPHANAGALNGDDLSRLRKVSASQGMMLESLDPDLACHRMCPDKEPQRRLATLEEAGRLSIPFTTGLLVGIGEDRSSRIQALQCIAESHARYGHIQEVIIQNFLPKPGTAMRNCDPGDSDEYLDTISLARLLLPPEIHLQAPPNLTDDFGDLVSAGIDDWGGISPITADHVNPERPWPGLEPLRQVTEDHGHVLAPRLTVYPEFASDPMRWLHSNLHFAVLDRSDSESLARDDPGTHLPEVFNEITDRDGSTARRLSVNSTAWYSGAPRSPIVLVPGVSTSGGPVNEVLDGVLDGQEAGHDELVTLFSARGGEVVAIAEVADEMRREINGESVTFVANRNINYTNICTYKCRFCGFSKGPMSLDLRGTPYLLEIAEIVDRAATGARMGATEVCLQGGIHPDFDGDYYIAVTKAVCDAVPDIHVHGFTALEVIEGARRLAEPLSEYLQRLMDAGLKSLPGTAAEILDDGIRELLCPDKISSDEWLDAHRTAHAVGLASNVTMMFGSVERPDHWVRHLLSCRDLQKETGGFTEFVGLPFVHMASPIYLQHKARRGPTFRETLLVHAVARIAYRDLIPNIQASWVKIGCAGVRQLLQAGANDLGGTLIDENISRAAGADHGQMMTEVELRALVEPLGRNLKQRTTLYEHVESGTRLDVKACHDARIPIPVTSA